MTDSQVRIDGDRVEVRTGRQVTVYNASLPDSAAKQIALLQEEIERSQARYETNQEIMDHLLASAKPTADLIELLERERDEARSVARSFLRGMADVRPDRRSPTVQNYFVRWPWLEGEE